MWTCSKMEPIIYGQKGEDGMKRSYERGIIFQIINKRIKLVRTLFTKWLYRPTKWTQLKVKGEEEVEENKYLAMLKEIVCSNELESARSEWMMSA